MEKNKRSGGHGFAAAVGKMNKTTLVVALGMIGIGLIALSPLLSGSGKTEVKESSAPEAEQYAKSLEDRLERILSRTDGVGEVEVMITLDGGYNYKYAVTEATDRDTTRNQSSDQEVKTQEKISTEVEYILVEGANGEEPLVLMVSDPVIKGVVVICEGGGDPVVVNRVVETVKTALGISAGKIAVHRLDAGE